MPAITTRIDPHAKLTVHTLEGPINAEDIITTIEAYYLGQPTPLILWDFTAAQFKRYRESTLQSIVEVTRRHAATRPGGKTALVMPGDFQFGTGRVFEVFAELGNLPIAIRSFRSLPEARAWLGCL